MKMRPPTTSPSWVLGVLGVGCTLLQLSRSQMACRSLDVVRKLWRCLIGLNEDGWRIANRSQPFASVSPHRSCDTLQLALPLSNCPAQLQQERAPEEAPPCTVPLKEMHTVLPSFCARRARRGRLAGLDTRFGRHRTTVETDPLHRCPPVFSAPATDNRALCHCYMRLLAYFPQTSRKRLTGLGHLLNVVERLWSASQPSCAAVPAQVLPSRHLVTLLGINRLLTGPSSRPATSKMASCV